MTIPAAAWNVGSWLPLPFLDDYAMNDFNESKVDRISTIGLIGMHVNELPVATWADRSSLALFLDIDGTLVPIAPTPAEVRPSPDLPRLLTHAATDLGNALAIVSGREITSIDQVTQNAVPYAAGSHGAEFRLGFGQPILRPVPQPDIAGLGSEVLALMSDWPGILVEPKRAGLAVHYRKAPQDRKSTRLNSSHLVISYAVIC